MEDMCLVFTEDLVNRVEQIYAAQTRPLPYYKFVWELNQQFLFAESLMKRRGYKFKVSKVSQRCNNLHVSVFGEEEQVAAIDSALIREQTYQKYSHFLVLEFVDG